MSNFGKTFGASSPILLFIVLFIGLLLFGRVDQTAALSRSSGLSDGFTARLSTSNQPYLRGEPVIFKFELSHPTRPASEWRELLYITTRISVIAKNSGGQEFRWEGEGFVTPVIHQKRAAGMTDREIEFKLPFDLDTVQRIFPQTGIYDVKVEYTYTPDRMSGVEAKLVSAPIRVNIHEPTGTNRMAYDYYQNSVRPILDRRVEREALEVRGEFSRRFGESVYSKYNTFELGRLYAAMGNIQAAENEFYSISDVDFYLANQVDMYLQRLGSQLGQATPRTKRPRVQSNIPNPSGWIERLDIRPNYNIAPIPAPVLVPNPAATP